MKRNIWIINEYAGSPNHGMEFRHYYLAKEFLQNDFSVTIISSTYSHLFKNSPKKGKEKIDDVNYLWLKTFNYGQSHNRKRVLKWFLFALKIFILPFRLKKPDVIIVSPMAPFSILPAWLIAKIFRAKLIFEVKDIWPLSLVKLGGFSPKHPFIQFMKLFENFALKKSDKIVSNLQNYDKYLEENRINRDFKWISNGIDLTEMKDIEPISPKLENLIPKDKFIVGYTGTIGTANALDSFLASSQYLKNDNIVFVLIGDGQEKGNLKLKFKSKNILFLDSIPKRQIQSVLNHFDICFIGWNKKDLYKYGISANKIFDYMYSGKPILNAFSGGENVLDIADCGITVEAENPQEIAKGVLKFYNMSEAERLKMGKNGHAYVINHFTYEKLSKDYMSLF
jgi:glycosyltransferase involved in cell wall biosynthesis